MTLNCFWVSAASSEYTLCLTRNQRLENSVRLARDTRNVEVEKLMGAPRGSRCGNLLQNASQ
jgi:hypothetical protein